MSDESISINDVLHGALAGMIAGAVASWVMNQYSAAQQQRAQQQSAQRETAKRSRAQGTERPRARTSKQRAQQAAGGEPKEGDDATVKTAQAISRNLFGHELSPQEKKVAGPAVHYAYGTLVGGLYGAVAEVTPLVSAGFGLLYGMALWALGDEAAVSALRLGPPPTQVPPRKHADYLAVHLVYGITLDLTRRVLRLIV
jgi:putative membrane protein